MTSKHDGKNKLRPGWGDSTKGFGKKQQSKGRRMLDKLVIKEETVGLQECERCKTLLPIKSLNHKAIIHHNADKLQCIDAKACRRRQRKGKNK